MGLFIPLPIRVPSFIKWMHPSWYIWDKPSKEKTIYLTFDDGPIPEVTTWVLNLLKQKDIKATFFCIGDNVQKHPKVFKQILDDGHTIGNHTQHHLKGWKHTTEKYVYDVALAETTITHALHLEEKQSPSFPLFRPPYGKIKRKQAKQLRKKGYQIIMYRTVAYDWEASTTPEQCLQNIIKHTRSGDLVVFHDSVKASKNMKYALPKVIDYFLENGYCFKPM
ncbi:polysaccharide deacetylase family protein [uncultured Dokdonia sp.]|uniref:polysaccharide deacetylase family protein n=1 Tax=uncultured Dokdonia sp. TaxID=575653 RepID=UPI00260BC802|nr:polysaccharide deacetylase family protein [uncultured Dokdonia sp.]